MARCTSLDVCRNPGMWTADMPWGEGATLRKTRGGGSFSTTITLRGMGICTESETISLPMENLVGAQELLSNPAFGTGETRIDLGLLQGLMGEGRTLEPV